MNAAETGKRKAESRSRLRSTGAAPEKPHAGRARTGTLPRFPLSAFHSAKRRGFTLTELLIVITIISLLMAMTFVGLREARTRAQISKTKNLIVRLHYIIAAQYDSYRSRRLPMDLRAYVLSHRGDSYPIPATGAKWPEDLARAKVNAIRDLMRMEMPDRWSDVTDGPLVLPAASVSQWPTVTQRYLRIYKDALTAAGADAEKQARVNENGAAELLYMIVMAIPDAAEQFHATEIGDVDGDTLPEFHDAWGRPIRFLRWPSGFFSDAAANYYGDSELQSGPNPLPSGATNPNYRPDPFDPRGVLSPSEGGFALYPLIYSAGPDGEYDINIGKASGGAATHAYSLDARGNLNPFAPDALNHAIGQPMNNDTGSFSDLEHYDNVHNHRLDLRQGR